MTVRAGSLADQGWSVCLTCVLPMFYLSAGKGLWDVEEEVCRMVLTVGPTGFRVRGRILRTHWSRSVRRSVRNWGVKGHRSIVLTIGLVVAREESQAARQSMSPPAQETFDGNGGRLAMRRCLGML